MPFYLYRLEEPWCHQVSRVSLLPILKQVASAEVRNSRGPWHATKERMLRAMDVLGWKRHLLIIDLKPDNDKNLSLYEIEDVWGFASVFWAPLALRLNPLFVDEETKNAAAKKLKFRIPSTLQVAENGGPVHEFLYVNHFNGIKGTWRWGRNGVVNAALLWPDALAYFISEIGQKMTWEVNTNSRFAARAV